MILLFKNTAVMERILRLIGLIALVAIGLCACEGENAAFDGLPGLQAPENGEYVCLDFKHLQWKAVKDQMGSCYVKTNSPNPLWYDLVICTEDVTDFSIDYYHHYLFLHIDLDSLGSVKNHRIIYYKNKNTERSGDYELYLVSLDGELSIVRKDDRLSGVFEGRLQNTSRTSDVRKGRFEFHNIPIETINQGSNARMEKFLPEL